MRLRLWQPYLHGRQLYRKVTEEGGRYKKFFGGLIFNRQEIFAYIF